VESEPVSSHQLGLRCPLDSPRPICSDWDCRRRLVHLQSTPRTWNVLQHSLVNYHLSTPCALFKKQICDHFHQLHRSIPLSIVLGMRNGHWSKMRAEKRKRLHYVMTDSSKTPHLCQNRHATLLHRSFEGH